MGFDGYLIKLGTYVFPMKYIAEEEYNIDPHQRLDLEAIRDGKGGLHREVTENKPTVIEFNTVSGMTNKEVKEIFDNITENYVNEDERKLLVTYYIPEKDSYSDPEYMYIPNMKFPIEEIDGNTVVYEPLTFKFIGY